MNKIIPLMVTIFMVVLVSGCITDDSTNETNTLSQNGVSFQYPLSWGVASVASPNGVAAVGDPQTASDGNPTTSVVIQTVNNTNNYDLKTAYDKNYATFFNNTGNTKVSEATFILNNAQAYEMVYSSADSGVSKKYRAVWVQRGSNIYVILCSARVEDYDAQQSNFDLVVNSFQAS
jgi:Tfp pilus assembly protein FimT